MAQNVFADLVFSESFFCPLTHELMEDPVVDPEGNSYERTAIETWLRKDSTSPITRSPLTISNLVPNRALREAIEAKCKELGFDVKTVKVTARPPVQPAQAGPTQSSSQLQLQDGATMLTEQVTLSVTCNNSPNQDEVFVLTSIQPPVGTARAPADICCVVDVSGSMGTEATLKTDTGSVESHGLSILDIVKHAVRTIMCSLQPHDRLALVTYSTNARTRFDLMLMDEQGKAKAESEVEAMTPDGSTNLWDGLQTGLELLRKGSKPGRLSSLMLLTDGLPNITPPRGELAMLKRYRDEHQQLSCTINTFGFGYDINSELLRDIALEGDGMYSFIPDSSFVGTAFVNSVSNLLAIMAKNVNLSLEPLNGAKIIKDGVVGIHGCQYTSWGVSIQLCSLQYGQNKDAVIRMSIPATAAAGTPYLTATLKYEHWNHEQPLECSVEATSRDGGNEVDAQRFRQLFVDRVGSAMGLAKKSDLPGAQAVVKQLVGEMNACTDKKVSALLEDLTGQVTEAFSLSTYYQKWGRHYLPSLMRAHQLQQCNNFKDPGIQHYGGEMFRQLRDQVDDIFCKLPPPKPSIKRVVYSRGSAGPQRSAPVSMSVYNNSSAPCFDGECLVAMADGSSKNVKLLAKGDLVMTPNHKNAEVVCVVKTHCHDGKAELVDLPGGLRVTPYHPVRVGGSWNFPCSLGSVATLPCPAVYSFVLQSEHVMIIDGIECVTLGHDFQDEVVCHPYFGSQVVIEDLKKMHGWGEGLVQLFAGCLVRDTKTGLVCGLHNAPLHVEA